VRLSRCYRPGCSWIRKRFKLSPAIEKQLLAISPRQMDRRLAAKKNQKRRRIYGRTSRAICSAPHPGEDRQLGRAVTGLHEVDLVSHSGNSGEGEFGYSLNITDIQTTWTETRALLGKGQTAVQQALDEIAGMLPFRLLAWTRTTDRNSSTGICRLGAKETDPTHRGTSVQEGRQPRISSKRTGLMYEAIGWEPMTRQNAVEAMTTCTAESCAYGWNLYLPS